MVTLKRAIFLLSCMHVIAGLAIQDCYGMADEHLQEATAPAVVVEQPAAQEASASVEATPVASSVEAAPVVEEGTPAVVVEQPAAQEASASVEATPVASSVEAAPVVEEGTPAVVVEQPAAQEASASVETTPVAPTVEPALVVETAPTTAEQKVEMEQSASVGGAPLLTTVVKEENSNEVAVAEPKVEEHATAPKTEEVQTIVQATPVAEEKSAIPVASLASQGLLASFGARLKDAYAGMRSCFNNLGACASYAGHCARDGVNNAAISVRNTCANVYAQHPMAVKTYVAAIGVAVVTAAAYRVYRWYQYKLGAAYVRGVVDQMQTQRRVEAAGQIGMGQRRTRRAARVG